MRRVNVPVDMSSEQRSILGVISGRQLIYILIGGSLIYSYIPLIFNITEGLPFAIRLVICVISSFPVLVIVIPLAFIKKRNYHMYLDYYLLIKLLAKTQHGRWRKGPQPKKWMEEL